MGTSTWRRYLPVWEKRELTFIFLGKSLYQKNEVKRKLHMSLPCLFPTSNTSRHNYPFVQDSSQPSEA